MRTLKKVLALSMVFAMAFSMMAGAAFNDQDKIDASLTEDIQLLTALEVFQGDEKGDFNPTDNVTRAQAAKMIYVLKNNGQDDEAAAFKGQSVYSDVPSGHWAEGYINYCTNLGIMSGWTEGSVRKFDPNGNVTGLELTKMLLCMIGYRSDIQGYTGNGWQTNVLRDGATSAVTTNYLPTIYNAAPRQWTARLMANAINAPYVSYSRGEVVQGSATDATVSYGEQYLGLRTVEGYLKSAGKVGLPELNKVTTATASLDEEGDEIVVAITSTVSQGETKGDKDLTGANRVFKTTVDPMMLGQHVKVYYKATNTTTSNYKVYSVLPTGKSKVYDLTLGDVTLGKAKDQDYETIKFSGYNGGSAKQYTTQNIILVENLYNITKVAPNTQVMGGSVTEDAATTNNFAKMGGNSNEAIRFVDQDNDGYIDLAFTNKVDYAIVGNHNAARNTIRFVKKNNSAVNLVGDPVAAVNSEAAYKKINFVNDVVADDVVSVTLDVTAGKQVWNVAKVEPVTGSVSGYTLNNAGTKYSSVTLNGTSTNFAKDAVRVPGYTHTSDNDTSILNDTTFYTDGKYIVYSKGGEGVASVGNLAYIIDVTHYNNWSNETYYVKALLSDGTQGEYEVAATYENNGGNYDAEGSLDKTNESGVSGGVKASLLAKGNVMSYSLSNNKITLSQLKSDKAQNGIKFVEGVQQYDQDKNTYATGSSYGTLKLADEAYVFVVSKVGTTDAKYNVVKASELGKDLLSKNSRTLAVKRNSDGMTYVVFGTLEIEGSAVSTAAEYAFVKSAANYAVVDGEHVAQMTVVLPNGEETVIKKTETTVTGANGVVQTWNGYRNRLVKYELDTNGNVDTIAPVAEATTPTINTNNEVWYKVTIQGWSGTSAMVALPGQGAVMVNVASDAKIHIVDVSGTNYALTEGSVELTAKEEDGETYVGQSAYIYVQDVNGQPTITDIFSADGGVELTKMFKPE